MSRYVLVGLVVLSVVGCAAPSGGKSDEKKKADRFQGVWRAVYAEVGGAVVPDDKTGRLSVEFDGNRLSLVYPSGDGFRVWHGTFTVDQSAQPNNLHLKSNGYVPTELDRANTGILAPAIYRWNGGELTIAFRFGEKPPAEFDSNLPGVGCVLRLARK